MQYAWAIKQPVGFYNCIVGFYLLLIIGANGMC